MSRMLLGELVEMRTGYPFRGRIDRVESGGCRLVQMGDVHADTAEVGDDLAHVAPPPGWEKHRLRHGDLLFVGRGMRNDAATFVGTRADVIAAPHLFVLRLRPEHPTAPRYLTWFLNLPETQKGIRSFRAGSALPFVPMGTLGRLEVPLPSLKVQNLVADIQGFRLEEQRLLDQIKEQRQALVDGLMSEAVRWERAGARSASAD